jgi:hypothetical protein
MASHLERAALMVEDQPIRALRRLPIEQKQSDTVKHWCSPPSPISPGGIGPAKS